MIIDFIIWGVLLVVAFSVGSFVLNIGWMIIVGIVCGITEGFKFVFRLFKKKEKKEENVGEPTIS